MNGGILFLYLYAIVAMGIKRSENRAARPSCGFQNARVECPVKPYITQICGQTGGKVRRKSEDVLLCEWCVQILGSDLPNWEAKKPHPLGGNVPMTMDKFKTGVAWS
jgi:hypothetical protein